MPQRGRSWLVRCEDRIMANFAGRIASLARRKVEQTDVGAVTKQERVGIRRGHNVLPYNVMLRGLAQRVDRTKIP